MASAHRFEETPQTEPLFTVFVETPEGGRLSADTVSRLIMDPTRAFQEYFAGAFGAGEVTFVVQRLRTGSLDLQMLPALIKDGIEVVTSFGALYGAGKVMAGFMTHLSDLFGLAARGENIGPLNTAKVMLANLADLVARGLAISITINIAGVNTPIEINARNARSIQAGIAKAGSPAEIETASPGDIETARSDKVADGAIDPRPVAAGDDAAPEGEAEAPPAGARPVAMRRRRTKAPQLRRT